MRDPSELWSLRAHALRRARKAARRGEPEGLHDLRVALRRAGALASAFGAKRSARKAAALVHALSDARQLEVDRRLLARIGKVGYLSPDASTALAARWEKLGERCGRKVARVAGGNRLASLVRRLERRGRRKQRRAVELLERAGRRAEAVLEEPLEGRDDDALHRRRIQVKEARYLAEDLAALGVRRFASRIERERKVQEALGRWNDLRIFRRRIAASLEEAQERGAVTLSAEIGRLLAALDATVARQREAAIEASREASTVVVPLRRQARR